MLQQKCGSLETVSRRELPEQQLYTHIHTDEHHVTAHLLPPSPLKETLEWFATAFYGRFYARSKTSQSGRRLSSSQRRRQTTSARVHSGVVCERACEPSPGYTQKNKKLNGVRMEYELPAPLRCLHFPSIMGTGVAY